MLLSNEVLSRELAPLLMHMADVTNQVIEVTGRGVEVRREFYTAPMRCKRVEALERQVDEVTSWVA